MIASTRQSAAHRLDHASRSSPSLEPTCGETRSKELRHGRSLVSCSGLSLIGVDGDAAGIYPFRCHRWRCSTCGRRKVNQTRKRILAGLDRGATWFLTLTSPGSECPAVSLDHLSQCWKAFHLRLTRHVGHIEYIAVLELQKRGSPHFHVLVQGPFVSRRWLSIAAAEVATAGSSTAECRQGGLQGI